MTEEKEMSELDSLSIIHQMIHTAKREQKDDGKGWILWGWMLLAASVGTIVNMKYGKLSSFFFWNMFGVFTILFALYETIFAFFIKKKVKVKTYTSEIFKKLNVGFFISLMFIIVGMNIGFSPIYGFPLLMSLYGFWILIYGAVLDFKPSIIGAFAMWALAYTALFFARDFEVTMMLHAAGVVCGYIIPGHMANHAFKKVLSKNSSNQYLSV